MPPFGERTIIERIRGLAGAGQERLVRGIGDDCAIVGQQAGLCSLVTLDTLVEGVHFDPAWHPPLQLGRKAAAVNVSDIAAMGGIPRFALLSLALPATVAPEWLDAFMDGFLGRLAEYDVALIGGDTVKSTHEMVFSITLFGEAPAGEVLCRSGALAGDLVLVSNTLGDAAAGLALCQVGLGAEEKWQPLVAAHLDPAPQVELGRVLATSGLVHSMLDLSDGLATDLAHICKESGVGAEVDADLLPVSSLLVEAAARCGQDSQSWALSGGEDYQLLFTVAPENKDALVALVQRQCRADLRVVGRIVEGAGVLLRESGKGAREISYQGYEHFR